MSGIIFIIGMSGTGKTAWGRRIAERFHIPFKDIDEHIEATQQKRIAQIFNEVSEAGFRKMESEALRFIITHNAPPLIISCGGGTPVDPDNLKLMKEHGILVYLKANISTILNNLDGQMAERPMLTNGVIHPAARLRELYEKRKKVYEQADYTFQVEDLSVDDFTSLVAGLV